MVTMGLKTSDEEATFSREFKLEAVKLVTERGAAVVQASRDLELSEWVDRSRMSAPVAAKDEIEDQACCIRFDG